MHHSYQSFPTSYKKSPYALPRTMAFYSQLKIALKGSVQLKLRWVKNSASHCVMRIGLGLWRWALFLIFNSPSSRIEHISVSGQYSKIIRRFL